MPCYGGMCPAPRRMGGGRPRTKLIFDALASSRGTGIAATDPTTTAYVETLAVSRAIAAGWGTNQRLANQWDAARVTTFITRWESVFGITPTPGDSDVVRRARIATAQARVGQDSIHNVVQAELATALGSVLVAVEFISVANAVIHVPDGTYPFGTAGADAPWYSTVAHVLVRVTKPTGYRESDFYDAVAKIPEVLDGLLPAWVTVDWYRAPEIGAPIAVAGGPSAAGFYLDERNLNESVFDV